MLCCVNQLVASSGLHQGAAGLPGRQVPPRRQPPVGVAAGRDPGPSVDVLLHATLLRAGRATTAHHRRPGEAATRSSDARPSSSLCQLTFHYFQLLEAFYWQQDEIRGLREELNQREVRTTQASNQSQTLHQMSRDLLTRLVTQRFCLCGSCR